VSLVEGNVLSHVQMLARNLGIPNATAPPSLLAALAPLDGAEVLLAVSPAGSVVLEPVAGLPPRVLASLEQDRAAEAAGEARVAVPPPDLTVRRPLPLSELHAGLSGRVVGPKAANVGELARQFPGRVAPAIALPFGVFAEHAAGPRGPKERLDRAFALHRAGSLDEAALAAEVDAVRAQVEALALSPAVRKALEPLERELFGEPGSYGVFVRSDTNVEDLPGFTGAGLNRTIPHVVDPAAQRAAVPKVWASPFTSRSMAWRARILARPEEVYPSVLLMRSVPSTKSGVLVTADVATGGEGLTVATAWGVGGAVDGEEAEVVVLRPDGSTLLVTEAKSPWKRRLGEAGGVVWAPAAAGPVLTPGERDEVRRLAAEARERLAPAPGPDGRPLPWDIELGFVDGRLWLFQVRPLVERGSERAARAVAALVPPPGDRVERVDLTLPVAGPARAVAAESW
jgi:hypothetical protein